MANGIEFFEEKAKPWRVRWSEGGKRKRKYFSTEREARAFLKSREREREDWGKLALTLEERAAVAQLRELGGPMDWLRWAEEAGARRAEVVQPGRAIEDVAADYQRAGREVLGWSIRYRASVKGVINRFIEEQGLEGVGIRMVSREVVRAWVVDRVPAEATRRLHRAILAAFWRWAARMGEADAGVVEGITWERARRELVGRKPAWLRGQVDAFLDALDGPMLPGWVLRFGAGIRSEEVARMRWRDAQPGTWYGVDMQRKEIHLAPEWTKAGRYRRAYDLPPWVWKRLANAERDPEGWVVPRRYRDESGWRYRQAWKLGTRRALKAAGLPAMPHNLARHTWASHAYHRGLEWAMEVMGHMEGSRVFLTHYKGSVSAREAAEYWRD